ncbi:MAG: TolC family outer membrane protein [Lentisphaeraceae bacterium]|nr:TolC family outer membrane protein [Lentisphaeraceae bacterium]
MKRILLATAFFVVSQVSGEVTKTKSLKDAVLTAVEKHPLLSAASKQQLAAESRTDEAKGERLPSIDLRASSGREETENSTVESDGDKHRTLTRSESSLTVRQILYAGNRINSNIAKRAALASESSYRLLDEKERVAFDAVAAYLEYCRNRALLKLAETNVKVHDDILKTVTERKNRGMARDADVIQVKGRLALAKAQLLRELANKAAVTEQFEEAVNAKPDDNLEEPTIAQKFLPKTLIEAKQIAIVSHPSLGARKQNIKAAHLAADESDSAFKPEIAIELSANENDNVGGTKGNDDSMSAMVVLNWNLFSGGSDQARKVSLLLEADRANDLFVDEKRKIAKNIAVSWHDFKGTLVELNYFLQHEKASKETLVAFEEQYKLNQRTLFDLLNAQNELFLASSRVIETKYSKIQGAYSILANMGNVTNIFK